MQINKGRFRVAITILGLLLFCTSSLFSQKHYKRKMQEKYHAAKLAVLPIFVGEMGVHYERSFKPNYTFEVGLAYLTDTYIRNYLQEIPPVLARQVRPGFGTGLGLRYFPYKKFQSVYVLGEFKYRLYRKTFYENGMESKIKEFNQMVIPRFGIGSIYYFNDKLFMDWSVACGFNFERAFRAGDTTPLNSVKLHAGVNLKFGFKFNSKSSN